MRRDLRGGLSLRGDDRPASAELGRKSARNTHGVSACVIAADAPRPAYASTYPLDLRARSGGASVKHTRRA